MNYCIRAVEIKRKNSFGKLAPAGRLDERHVAGLSDEDHCPAQKVARVDDHTSMGKKGKKQKFPVNKEKSRKAIKSVDTVLDSESARKVQDQENSEEKAGKPASIVESVLSPAKKTGKLSGSVSVSAEKSGKFQNPVKSPEKMATRMEISDEGREKEEERNACKKRPREDNSSEGIVDTEEEEEEGEDLPTTTSDLDEMERVRRKIRENRRKIRGIYETTE